jgi:hypothetical protein
MLSNFRRIPTADGIVRVISDEELARLTEYGTDNVALDVNILMLYVPTEPCELGPLLPTAIFTASGLLRLMLIVILR